MTSGLSDRLLPRRSLLLSGVAGVAAWLVAPRPVLAASKAGESAWNLSDAEWKKRLSPEAYQVLRREGTERPFSSPLNAEKRSGTYHCAGCDLPLFSAKAKFDSGTGWPSFWQALPNAIGTSTDFKLIYPRTECHCARCGSHLGHIFDDGPQPTGKRHCINGVSLVFKPA